MRELLTNKVSSLIGSKTMRLWDALNLKLPIAQFDKDRKYIIPEKKDKKAAGIDIFAPRDFAMEPGDELTLGTNFAMAIPEGWVGLVFPRSSTGSIYKVKFANTIPILDCNYRGEIILVFTIAKERTIRWGVDTGDSICQLLLFPAPTVEIEDVALEDLGETDRGDQGFGWTGK